MSDRIELNAVEICFAVHVGILRFNASNKHNKQFSQRNPLHLNVQHVLGEIAIAKLLGRKGAPIRNNKIASTKLGTDKDHCDVYVRKNEQLHVMMTCKTVCRRFDEFKIIVSQNKELDIKHGFAEPGENLRNWPRRSTKVKESHLYILMFVQWPEHKFTELLHDETRPDKIIVQFSGYMNDAELLRGNVKGESIETAVKNSNLQMLFESIYGTDERPAREEFTIENYEMAIPQTFHGDSSSSATSSRKRNAADEDGGTDVKKYRTL